jgi:hypothetical protein
MRVLFLNKKIIFIRILSAAQFNTVIANYPKKYKLFLITDISEKPGRILL